MKETDDSVILKTMISLVVVVVLVVVVGGERLQGLLE
jgi:hypothetical protein